MISILVIHMYFGKLPNFFYFWLKSCELNNTVDFLIVSDQDICTKASNIFVYKCTLDNIKQRVDRLLNIPAALGSPHKLCDYKPIYGLLMQEYSEKYDFWGYCDSDLIFGDIRYFLTDEVLSKYNYILGMGHFHIQRTKDENFEKVWKSAKGVGDNAYWEKKFDPSKFQEKDNGPMWNEVYRSEVCHVFDEFPYGVSANYYKMFPTKVWTGYDKLGRCFDDIDPKPLFLRDSYNNYNAYIGTHYNALKDMFPFFERVSYQDNEINEVVYEKDSQKLYRIGYTKNGKIVKQECLYTHFLHRKMNVKTFNLVKYLIIPNSFIDMQEVSVMQIKKWSNRLELKILRIIDTFFTYKKLIIKACKVNR